jgi:hypothetical protein
MTYAERSNNSVINRSTGITIGVMCTIIGALCGVFGLAIPAAYSIATDRAMFVGIVRTTERMVDDHENRIRAMESVVASIDNKVLPILRQIERVIIGTRGD